MGLLDDAIREHLDLKRRSGGDPAEIERLEREALGPVRREFPGSTAVADDPRVHESGHAADDVHGHEEIPLEPKGHGGLDDDFGHDAPVAEPRRRGFLRRALASVVDDEHEETHPEPAPRREPPPLALEGATHHDDEPEAAGGGAPATPATPPDEQATQVHRVVEPAGRDEPPEQHEPVEQREPVEPLRERVAHDEPEPPEAPPAAPAGDASKPAEHAPADEPDPLEETPEFLQDAPEHDRLWFEQRPPRDFDFDG